MTSLSLMILGAGSDVGKSLLTAGLCRAYTRRGLRVRPFKPQNMSNNAAVTPGGGEIGRAQALQARACGVAPTVHMNPVLLKPQTDVGAQVVVLGEVVGNASARDYQALKGTLLPKVIESFETLRAEADLVLVEGAGSASEVNLRQGDIANLGFAEAAGIPAVLVGDIDRGGVIAQIVGAHVLMSERERTHLKGYIVNRFRGDMSLFDDGLAEISGRTGLKAFGIVPFFRDAHRLPAEDALALSHDQKMVSGAIKVCVPVLSRIANFDDLDPLLAEPDVAVEFIKPGTAFPGDADLIVLPGTKAVLADLDFLRVQGWDIDIQAHRRRGGLVLGLCGGYQMLGGLVGDPDGLEGAADERSGLGLLNVETVLKGDKKLFEVSGREVSSGEAVRGFEMHMGRTSGKGLENPMLEFDGRPEGAVSRDGRVMGCYLHGLFAADGFRQAFLFRIRDREPSKLNYDAEIETVLDNLASHLETYLDLDGLLDVSKC